MLLVTSRARGRWVFPKGRRNNGEAQVTTAEREAFEEAGVGGNILADFAMTAVVTRKISDEHIERMPVTYFPLRVGKIADEWPEREMRRRRWFTIDAALKNVDRTDVGKVVALFADVWPWLIADCDDDAGEDVS